MNTPSFWNQTTAALIQTLGSGSAGLAADEANRRLSVYGPNDAAAPKRRPAWQRFLVLFANPLVIILVFASALSAATYGTGVCRLRGFPRSAEGNRHSFQIEVEACFAVFHFIEPIAACGYRRFKKRY